MDLFIFLLVGLIAGWLAGLIYKGSGFGIVGNILIGIVGAVLGGMIFGALNIDTYGFLGTVVMSVIGSLVLIFLLNVITRGTNFRI